MTELLPDIDDYLNNIDENFDINLKNNEELIYIVRSKTGLTYEQCEIIIKEIFSNIRNEIIKENKVIIKNMGSFYITKGKNIQFKPMKTVRDKINGK